MRMWLIRIFKYADSSYYNTEHMAFRRMLYCYELLKHPSIY